MQLIAEGRRIKKAAQILGIDLKTVTTRRAAAMHKTKAGCTADQIRYAIWNKLVEPLAAAREPRDHCIRRDP